MSSESQRRALAAFFVAAGLVAIGVGGIAMYIAGGLTLAMGFFLVVLS